MCAPAVALLPDLVVLLYKRYVAPDLVTLLQACVATTMGREGHCLGLPDCLHTMHVVFVVRIACSVLYMLNL